GALDQARFGAGDGGGGSSVCAAQVPRGDERDERRLGMIRRGLFGACGGFFLLAAVAPSVAHADVRLDGDWSDDPDVTLDVDDVPRADAVNRLAAAAGWSVVIRAPKGDHISVHVKDQPASKVLDMLLSDGRYVARRNDTLVSVAPDEDPAPSAAIPPIPPIPPIPAIPPPG